MSEHEFLSYEQAGAVELLTLNRPEALNALPGPRCRPSE